MRFVNQRLKLIALEQRVLGSQSGARACAAGSRRLYHVRASADHLAHLCAHRLRSVRYPPGQPRIFPGRRSVTERANAVGHAASWRNEAKRDAQTRSRRQPFVHGHPKSGGQSSRVPHGRVAGLECLTQNGCDAQVACGARLRDSPSAGNVVPERRQVVVRVYKSGHQRHSRSFDPLRAFGNPHRLGAADVHYVAAFDQRDRI